MKCPYCTAQIAYYGERHGCSWPELSSGLPLGPEDFGGSDAESHYAAPAAWAELRREREARGQLSSVERPSQGVSQQEHHLKIWPDYFQQVRAGTKTFELRRNDRNFQVGDHLILQEWDPAQAKYTGAEIRVEVTSLSNSPDFLRDGFVCLSIRREDADETRT